MQEIHTMQETGTESKPEEIRKDSTKIYFFVVAIVALLATNVYFYVKYKNTGDQVYELTGEKVNMQAEIDRIEAEMDRLTNENVEINAALKASQDSVQSAIASLRHQLEQNNLTREQLTEAQQEINQLKLQVSQYKEEIEQLKNQNARLTSERDELKREISSSSERVAELEDLNTDLTDKVKVASALKISDIVVNGVKERNSDKENVETRARRTDKLKITFTIADNPLAERGMHDVYLRVIDPNGNLRTADYGLFEVNGNQIQYTYKTAIEFLNDGASYTIDWKDTRAFQKGAYTILLYANNAIMGQGSVVLK
ncbi:hypothetical protein GCM10011386_18660 [Parapedobacter defluvii]|uniref:Chromosome segregation protein SMC n=1 Tax=Parapedobacter defluvii TaxID=2045106 RepID=A0ABQ1LM41_9SPHI|nr:hypothetical protein [Parapedobacter defluvii]GGC26840.1 hypothetical protein GCM10011386_18660 [Parapedobacter defluvii]